MKYFIISLTTRKAAQSCAEFIKTQVGIQVDIDNTNQGWVLETTSNKIISDLMMDKIYDLADELSNA